MRLDRHIVLKRIVDLKSRGLKAALSELLELCDLPEKGVSQTALVEELLVRERQMTTYLEMGFVYLMPGFRWIVPCPCSGSLCTWFKL